jgi:hypothetical protein
MKITASIWLFKFEAQKQSLNQKCKLTSGWYGNGI